MDGFMTAAQAAEELGITVRTLYGWTAGGRIPYRKVGHRLWFDPADVERAGERHEAGWWASRHPEDALGGAWTAEDDGQVALLRAANAAARRRAGELEAVVGERPAAGGEEAWAAALCELCDAQAEALDTAQELDWYHVKRRVSSLLDDGRAERAGAEALDALESRLYDGPGQAEWLSGAIKAADALRGGDTSVNRQ